MPATASIPIVLLPVASAGHDDHTGAPRLRPDAAARFIAVQLWQSDVEQKHFGVVSLRLRDGFQPVVRCPHLVPQQAQQQGQALGGVTVIVHDKNADGRRGRG